MITENGRRRIKNLEGVRSRHALDRALYAFQADGRIAHRPQREMLQAVVFNHVLNGYAGPEWDVTPSTLYCVPIPNGSINRCAPFSRSDRLSISCVPSSSFCSLTDAPMPARNACCVITP